MKSLENTSNRWHIIVDFLDNNIPIARIVCGICQSQWAGVKECCNEEMPFEMISKRYMMNTVFDKYNIRS